jgi:hypothetical protein
MNAICHAQETKKDALFHPISCSSPAPFVGDLAFPQPDDEDD